MSMPILCPTEDSANCIWLAPVQGNHEGQSFIDVNGTVTYLSSPVGETYSLTQDVLGTGLIVGMVLILAVVGTVARSFFRGFNHDS